jgi:hypothetical protein
MHVLFQVKVPLDLAQGFRAKMDLIIAAHVSEVVELGKRAKVAPDPTKLLAQSATLDRRGKRLNLQTLIREALRVGYESINKRGTGELMERMAEDEIVRGRPMLRSVGGTKRGG